MDYEKAYKEARARLELCLRTGLKIDPDYIFPELAESEDERIRKLLVWQVYRNIEDETNDLAQSVYDGIKGHDPDLEESIEDWKKCLAWLEKQKEQKQNSYKPTYEQMEALRFAVNHLAKEHVSQSVRLSIMYDHLKEQKEQKPAEWSEEDEKDIVHILKVLDDCYIYGKHDLSKTDYDNLTNTLKSLRLQPQLSEEETKK